MTKVLLHGSTGFLGVHVLEYLKAKTNWDVYVSTGYDLTNELPEVFNQDFDYIINLASLSSVEASVKAPVKFIQTNTSIVLNALEHARKHPPKVFLHMSTVEVYNVTSPYGASKSAQEDICNAYWKTYDVPVVILRPSNIIGEGQSPDKFVPKVIQQIKNNETISLYTSEGKLGSRLYIPVTNVADAILFLLKKYPYGWEKYKDFPVHFDVTGGQKLTNLHMAEKIASLLDKPLNYELIEPKTVRPTYARSLVTHGTKLNKLGWEAPIKTIDEGLAWIKP